MRGVLAPAVASGNPSARAAHGARSIARRGARVRGADADRARGPIRGWAGSAGAGASVRRSSAGWWRAGWSIVQLEGPDARRCPDRSLPVELGADAGDNAGGRAPGGACGSRPGGARRAAAGWGGGATGTAGSGWCCSSSVQRWSARLQPETGRGERGERGPRRAGQLHGGERPSEEGEGAAGGGRGAADVRGGSSWLMREGARGDRAGGGDRPGDGADASRADHREVGGALADRSGAWSWRPERGGQRTREEPPSGVGREAGGRAVASRGRCRGVPCPLSARSGRVTFMGAWRGRGAVARREGGRR